MTVLAVDGGQTGIRARTADTTPVEVGGVSRLEGDVVVAVADRIEDAWHALGEPVAQRVVLGLTTAPRSRLELARLGAVVAGRIGADEVWVMDDSVTAHAGALSGDSGVVLRAGTGVACLAVPRAGEPRIIDGAGYLLGDEGAGYWTGREGLRAVIRAHDGRGPATALTTAAARYAEPAELAVSIHSLPRAVSAIAGFAPDVLELAETDEVASGIVDAAAEALAETVSAAVAVARDTNGVPVALGGRLIESNPVLHERLTTILARSAPDALVRDPEASPLDGALALGLGEVPNRYGTFIHHWQKDRPQ